jgi:hypothetical protein
MVRSTELFLVQKSQKIVTKGFQLVVLLTGEIWNYWDSIVELVCVGIRGVVDEQKIFEISADDSQILHEVTLVGDVTVLTVEPVLNELP